MTVRGVFCAAATPVDEAGNIDTALFVAHASALIEDGCTGLAMLGTTGEANSFALEARKSLVEATLKAGLMPEQLLPGTGVAAIAETVELTRHALSVGVTQVVMLPPFYYKNVSEDGVFAAYARIIDAVNDTRLRVILYHIPQMSAVPITHDLIRRLLAAYPGIVVGIKDSAGDFANMQAMLNAFPGFSVLAGADPLMKPLLEAGGHGCITATSNIAARELATVFRHAGDREKAALVDRAQQRIVDIRNVSTKFAQIPSIKAMVARRHGRPRWANVMPPLTKLDGRQQAELNDAMNTIEAEPA